MLINLGNIRISTKIFSHTVSMTSFYPKMKKLDRQPIYLFSVISMTKRHRARVLGSDNQIIYFGEEERNAQRNHDRRSAGRQKSIRAREPLIV